MNHRQYKLIDILDKTIERIRSLRLKMQAEIAAYHAMTGELPDVEAPDPLNAPNLRRSARIEAYPAYFIIERANRKRIRYDSVTAASWNRLESLLYDYTWPTYEQVSVVGTDMLAYWSTREA